MNNKFFLLVPLIILLSTNIHKTIAQNCPCTVNAGPDKNLCEPGGTVTLNGSITGQPISIEWSPQNGLSNPNVVNPSATVDQTTVYTLTIKCVNNTNLVNNANFNNGNTGFTSDYTYSATNLVPEGIYTVTNNPQSVHPGFAPCGDHTGGGQMMVINGAGTPNQDVWCQTIPVIPNTEYAFETWVASVVAGAPALLQFSINGQTIGPVFEASNSTCQWEKFTSTWNSGPSATATICIVNQNTTLGGNDFALDDISFKEVCTINDKVTVFVNPVKQTYVQASICQGQTYTLGGKTFQNEGLYDILLKTWKGCDSTVTLDLKVIEVEAEIDPPYNLDCGLTEIYLYGDKSSFGPEYSYKWTSPTGGIISDPTQSTVLINKPGKYTLTVTYNDGSIICTKTATVTVVTDYTKPTISAGLDGMLSCADTTLTLKGTVYTPINNFSVKWSSPNGKFLSKTDTLNPLIGSPGIYILTVTSFYTGCTASDTLIIGKDPSLPLALISGNNILNCYTNSLWINGFQSDKGSGFSFTWSTTNGKFNSKTDSLAVEVAGAGSYNLTVQNLMTGCKSTATFNVVDDFIHPVVDAGNTDTLSCILPDLKITGVCNIPDSLSLLKWSSPNGNFISSTDSLTATVGSPGMYFLKVQNILNGCYTIDSVEIVKDAKTPIVAQLKDQTLTCKNLSLFLDGTGSSLGPEYQYNWTTTNGNLVGANDQITANCDQPGTYVLSIVNILNGCIATDTLFVDEDKIIPTSDAGPNEVLTCKKTIIQLDGNQSSKGSQYTYQWTTTNGNILNGSNGLLPNVNQPATYYITVLNQNNGCSDTDSVTVSIDTITPAVIVPSDLTITCQSPQISINATNLSASGNFQYAWTTLNGNILNGQQNLTAQINKPGLYTLTTTNQINGCIDIDVVNIVSNEELPVVNAGSDLILSCKNVIINANASVVYTGGNLQIIWTSNNKPVVSGANTLSPQIGFSGIYTLTVKDTITGCSAADDLKVDLDTISPKSAIIEPGILNCKISSVPILLQTTNQNWSYSWSTLNGNIVGPINGSMIEANKIGEYVLTITDELNGCSSILSKILSEDKNPPQISAGPDREITCTQNIVTLNGSIQGNTSDKTISWLLNGQVLPNSNLLNPSVKTQGIYQLFVVDELNGCTAVDSMEVTENNNKPTGFSTDVIPPGCTKLGTVTVSNISGGVGPYAYSINGGAFQSLNYFESISSGSYLVTIKDINGCLFSSALDVPVPPVLTASLPQLITIEYGAGQQLFPELNIPETSVDKIQWKPITGLSCSDCLNPIASPLNEIYYTLTVTDVTGCTASAKVQLLVLKDFKLYVPNAFSPDANGINDKWQIYGDINKVVKIKSLRIFDRWGEALFEAFNFPVNDPEFGWNGKYHGKYLDPAVFVYYFEAEFIDGSTKLYKGDINLMR